MKIGILSMTRNPDFVSQNLETKIRILDFARNDNFLKIPDGVYPDEDRGGDDR